MKDEGKHVISLLSFFFLLVSLLDLQKLTVKDATKKKQDKTRYAKSHILVFA